MSNYNPYTKRQTMIAPDYEVYRYRSTYMNEVELHHHDFYEIYLLLRGRVEYIVENQLYRVRPGDWMLCSPLELHQARIATDADAYERIVLWIARPYLEGLSTPRTSLTRCFDTTVPGHTNLLRLPGATGAPLRTTVDKLCALKADKAYGSDLLAQSALVELLVGLNRAAAERGDARPTGTSDQVVDAVLHYINEHYSEALTLDQLSEKFFISKYHLLRKFDAQVGTTVHRYILQKRLLNAKQLLAGGVPPNEVCPNTAVLAITQTFTAHSGRNTTRRRGSIFSQRGGSERLPGNGSPPETPTFFCDQKKVAKKSPAVADAADPALGAARP